jgi:hypothetical protein
MLNEDLPVNKEEEFDTICLDQDEQIHNYTIVPNALIRDKNISPNCRWLIIYLISNKPGWTIKTNQLWAHTRGFIGRDLIRKVLNEAIDAGYVERKVVPRKVGNRNLIGYSYKVSSTPKFKKCFREPDFQGTEIQEPEIQGAENKGTKEVLSKEVLSIRNNTPLIPQVQTANAVSAEADEEKVLIPPEEKPKRTKTPSDFTPRVKELSDKMVNLLVSANPDWLLPKNLHAFMSQVDLILNHDKRDAERVLNVFLWAISDSFWMDKISKPNPAKYLRDNFAQLAPRMDAKPAIKPNSFSISSNPNEALKTMQQMKSRSI